MRLHADFYFPLAINRKMGHTFLDNKNESCIMCAVHLHKNKNLIKLFIQNLVPKETPELSAIHLYQCTLHS